MSQPDFSELPDVIVLSFMSFFDVHGLCTLSLVCKKWNDLTRCNALWAKFIPDYASLTLDISNCSSTREVIRLLWSDSEAFGRERWYHNPLSEFTKYTEQLGMQELQQNYGGGCSKIILKTRLNPCYDLTGKFKFSDLDSELQTAFGKLFARYKDLGSQTWFYIISAPDIVERSDARTKRQVVKFIVDLVAPNYMVDVEDVGSIEDYSVSEDGEIIQPAEANQLREAGKDHRISYELLSDVIALFTDGSSSFREYFLDDGCFNENFAYAQSMLVSHSSVLYVKKYYLL